MSAYGIEFNIPNRSKFTVKDCSNSERYEYEIYAIDPVLIKNGKAEITTTINYRFSGNTMADIFSPVIRNNVYGSNGPTIDYIIKPDHYKLRPSSSYKTLTLTIYAVTNQDVKFPANAPIAKIILY